MEDGSKKRELYDIESDPSEKQNLINNHPDVTEQLVAKIIRTGRSTKGESQPNDTGWSSNLTWMEKW